MAVDENMELYCLDVCVKLYTAHSTNINQGWLWRIFLRRFVVLSHAERDKKGILSLICGLEYNNILKNHCSIVKLFMKRRRLANPFRGKFFLLHTHFKTKFCLYTPNLRQNTHPFWDKVFPFHTPKDCTHGWFENSPRSNKKNNAFLSLTWPAPQIKRDNSPHCFSRWHPHGCDSGERDLYMNARLMSCILLPYSRNLEHACPTVRPEFYTNAVYCIPYSFLSEYRFLEPLVINKAFDRRRRKEGQVAWTKSFFPNGSTARFNL